MSGGVPQPAPSSAYAVALLAELVRLGVRDVVVCPGSRSQALALAAAAAERAGAVRLHVRIDERSAAFFALGVARETGVPAPVIVTSGTAVANLLPAALEAHEGRVPMLLLTADRPEELRGIRSNQATRQAGLFDGCARWSVDVDVDAALQDRPAGEVGDASSALAKRPVPVAQRALAAALGADGRPPGPVQVNLAFREPLSGWSEAEPSAAESVYADSGMHGAVARFAALIAEPGAGAGDEFGGAAGAQPESPEARQPAVYLHDDDALAVVIAGAGAGEDAEEFARLAGLPLLAEAVSGARYGREAITAYAELIDEPEIGGLVERAIVFGHPTLTRQVPALLRRSDVEVVVVDPFPHADHVDPGRNARVVSAARVSGAYSSRSMHAWLGRWVVADRRIRAERTTLHEPDLGAALATGYKERSAYARAEVAALREPITRELLAESVWRATWPHDRLFAAASRLVRALDWIAPPRRVRIYANRGLAGIDGTVATALGVAVTSQSDPDPAHSAGSTRVLLGDLALLHDVGSLVIPEGEVRPRILLFVGNDGGGSIFDTLEAARTAETQAFDRVMFTPQHVTLRALAEAYGWEYARIETRGELERLLTAPVPGPMIVEVPLAR